MTTTTTRPDAALAPAEDDVPSPPPSPSPPPEQTRRWLVPVVAGAVGFGAGVAVGSHLTWRFSTWWKPL